MRPTAANVVLLAIVIGQAARSDATPQPQPQRAAVGVYADCPTQLVAAARITCRFAVHWASAPGTSGPLAGAEVTLRLRGLTLARGKTDALGSASMLFEIPARFVGEQTLEVSARSPLGRDQQRLKVNVVRGARLFVDTDQRSYRSGRPIRVQGLVVRRLDGKPLGKLAIRFAVVEASGKTVYRAVRRSSRLGIAAVTVTAALRAGTYRVVASSEQSSAERSVTVYDEDPQPDAGRSMTLHTDKTAYAPGERITGAVVAVGSADANKEVVRIALHTKHCRRLARSLDCFDDGPVAQYRRLDAAGRATFGFKISRDCRSGLCDEGQLRLEATLDKTRAERVLPLSRQRLRLSLVVPNATIARRNPSRVYLLVERLADGKPLAGATVRVLGLGAGAAQRTVRTDPLGIAALEVRPRPERSCSLGDLPAVPLVASVDTPSGHRSWARWCVPIGQQALRVRPASPAAGRFVGGAGSSRDVIIDGDRRRGDIVYLDLVKDGQIIETFTRRLSGNKAASSFQVPFEPASYGGVMSLRAYQVAPSGEREDSAQPALYVDTRRPQLAPQVAVAAGRGCERRLSIDVGTEAALWAQVVEQGRAPRSLLGLDEAFVQQARALNVQIAGKDLVDWLLSPRHVPHRSEAAGLLLSPILSSAAASRRSDPWGDRRQRWVEQAQRVIEATRKAIERLVLGARRHEGWGFAPDLVDRLVRARYLPRDQLRDPWQRVIHPEALAKIDPSFDFRQLAREAAQTKLQQLYVRLGQRLQRLAPLRLAGVARARRPVVIPADFVDRAKRRRSLRGSSDDLLDPWGQTFRVSARGQVVFKLADCRRYLLNYLYSVGPDGKANTDDDVLPAIIEQARFSSAEQLARIVARLSLTPYGRGVGRLRGRRMPQGDLVVGKEPVVGRRPNRSRRRLTRTIDGGIETFLMATDRTGKATLKLPASSARSAAGQVIVEAVSPAGVYGRVVVALGACRHSVRRRGGPR